MTNDARVRRMRILIFLGVVALAAVVVAVAPNGGGDSGDRAKRRQAVKPVGALDGIPPALDR